MQPRNLACVFLAALVLAGCNLPAQRSASPTEQHPVAPTVSETATVAATPSRTPPPSLVPATTTVTTTLTPTLTPTPSKAMLAITANSNCRQGPGASYKAVTGFTPGTDLEIVARNTENNFWQVKIPNTEDTCWVWGEYATPSGNVDTLPESVPTLVASIVPARPGSLFYEYTCSFGDLITKLRWADNADNETGYHVYRFDQLLAALPANSTTYEDNWPVYPGGSVEYSVEAYNDAGSSAKRTISFTCE